LALDRLGPPTAQRSELGRNARWGLDLVGVGKKRSSLDIDGQIIATAVQHPPPACFQFYPTLILATGSVAILFVFVYLNLYQARG
jgi:hypothetical protein